MSNSNPINLNNLDGRYAKPSQVASAIAASAANSWTPGDSGFLTTSMIPAYMMTGTGTPTNALIYFIRLPVRSSLTITNLVIAGTAAASSSATTGTFAAVYDPSGNRIAVSNEASTIFATAPVNSLFVVPLTTPVVVSLPWVYAAFLFNMTNAPTLAYTGSNAMARTAANIGLSTSNMSFATTPFGPTYTSMPTSVVYSNNVNFYSNPYFVAAT